MFCTWHGRLAQAATQQQHCWLLSDAMPPTLQPWPAWPHVLPPCLGLLIVGSPMPPAIQLAHALHMLFKILCMLHADTCML